MILVVVGGSFVLGERETKRTVFETRNGRFERPLSERRFAHDVTDAHRQTRVRFWSGKSGPLILARSAYSHEDS